ncbi:uncharacterized protein TNCT_260611 [Trichonephila clavata]|uniref:Uncharacterized protein n=1 Tax=Trichonephila clavata TaxID=2740835 RepID=A0A8X6KA35_TRICU|nr:uncharacterized protein TNCT_260611 [Trichonephila clavata]
MEIFLGKVNWPIGNTGFLSDVRKKNFDYQRPNPPNRIAKYLGSNKSPSEELNHAQKHNAFEFPKKINSDADDVSHLSNSIRYNSFSDHGSLFQAAPHNPFIGKVLDNRPIVGLKKDIKADQESELEHINHKRDLKHFPVRQRNLREPSKLKLRMFLPNKVRILERSNNIEDFNTPKNFHSEPKKEDIDPEKEFDDLGTQTDFESMEKSYPKNSPLAAVEEQGDKKYVPRPTYEEQEIQNDMSPTDIEEEEDQKQTPSSTFEEQQNQKRTPSPAFEEQENQKHTPPSAFEMKNQKHTPSSIFEEQKNQKHTPPSTFEEQKNQKPVLPSTFEEQTNEKHTPLSAFEEQENKKHVPPSAFKEQKNQKHTPPSVFEEQESQKSIPPSAFEQNNQKHTPSSIFKKQKNQKNISPSALEEEENQKHISSSAFEEQKNQEHTTSSTFEEQVNQKHIPPSSFEEQKNQEHTPPPALEEQENQKLIPPSSFEEQKNQKHTPLAALEEQENQKHMPSPALEEQENQKHILPSTFEEQKNHKHTPSSALEEQGNQKFIPASAFEEQTNHKHTPSTVFEEQVNQKHIPMAAFEEQKNQKHTPSSSFEEQENQKSIPPSAFEEQEIQKHIPLSVFEEKENQNYILPSTLAEQGDQKLTPKMNFSKEHGNQNFTQDEQKHIPSTATTEQDNQNHIPVKEQDNQTFTLHTIFKEQDKQKHMFSTVSIEQGIKNHIASSSSLEQDAQKLIPTSSFEGDVQKLIPASSSFEEDVQKHIPASSSFEQDAPNHIPASSSFEQDAQKYVTTPIFKEDYQDYVPISAYEELYKQSLIPKTAVYESDSEKHTPSLILQEQDDQKYVVSSIFQEEDNQITVSMAPYYAQDINETIYNTTSTDIPSFNGSDLKYFISKPDITTLELKETLPEKSENNSVIKGNGKKVIQLGPAHIEIGTDMSPGQLKFRLFSPNGSNISLSVGRKSLGEFRISDGSKVKNSRGKSENRRDKGIRIKMADKMMNETEENLSHLGSKQHELILSLSDLQRAQNMKDVLKMAKPLFKLGDRVSWKLKQGVGDAKYIEIGKLFKTTEGSNDVFYVSDKKGNVEMCESRLKETFKSNSIAIAFILILIMVILVLFLYALYFVGKKSNNKRGYTKLIPQEESHDKVAVTIDTPVEESEGEERKKRTFKEAVRLVQMIRKKIEKLADEERGSGEELTTEKEDESRPESLIIESGRSRKSLEPKKLPTENIETAIEKFVEDKPSTELVKPDSGDSDNEQLKERSSKASPVTRIFDWVKDRGSRASKTLITGRNHVSSSRSRKSFEPQKLQAEKTETVEEENKPDKSDSVDSDNDQLKERSSKASPVTRIFDWVKDRGSRTSKTLTADRNHVSSNRSRKSLESKKLQAEIPETEIEEEDKPDKSDSGDCDNVQLKERSSKASPVTRIFDWVKDRGSRTSKTLTADRNHVSSSRSRKSLEPKKFQTENIETLIEEENKPEKSSSVDSDNDQLRERSSKTPQVIRTIDSLKHRGSRSFKNHITDGNRIFSGRSRKSMEPKKLQAESTETAMKVENEPDKSDSDIEQLKERSSETPQETRTFNRGSRTSKNHIYKGKEYHHKDDIPKEPIEQHSVQDEVKKHQQEKLPQSSERFLKRDSTKSRVYDVIKMPPYYTSESNQVLQIADESDSEAETLSKPKTTRKRSRQKTRASLKKSKSSLDLQTLISTVETSDEGTIRAGPEELRTKMISTGEIKEIDSMLLGADWTQFVYCKDPSKVQSEEDMSFLLQEDLDKDIVKVDIPTKTKNDSTKSLEKEVGMSLRNAESVIRRGRPIAKNDFIYR